jgi:hypothetical protein
MSLIHLELILVQGDRHGSGISFLQVDNDFSQQHLLKGLSFLHHIYLIPLSEIHSCVDLHPGPLFCSTGLHISFCASTMLFLLLWLCNIV